MKVDMRKFLYLLCSLYIVPLSLSAQHTIQRDYISVQMEPDHADWQYNTGDSVVILLSVRRAGCALPMMEVECEWGPELREAERHWTLSSGEAGTVRLVLPGMEEPGFMTLMASVRYEGHRYTNRINLAFSPAAIRPTTPQPDDFDAFWSEAIAAARRIPLEPMMTLQPELCTPRCDVYEVRFQNYRRGNYLYGMLSVPKAAAERRLPVMIEWPGAGVKPHRGLQTTLLDSNVIVLEMGVNGIPVNRDDRIYADLKANALRDYWTIHIDHRDRYYYKPIYTGTVRTVDFLSTLPFVDSTRIAVSGGSQGGALSLVHAALDKRIVAVSVAYPALCEIGGYARQRVGGWPHLFRTADEPALDDKLRTADYYDVVNFARRVEQPLLFFIGYTDRTCCPTSTYSAYNVVPVGSKRLYLAQECAHWQYPEHRTMRHLFLWEYLK